VAPSSLASRSYPFPVLPLMTMTFNAGTCSRNNLTTSRPSQSGISTSVMTRSGIRLPTSLMASDPVWTSPTTVNRLLP
ncbi:uncharacterized protein METZ01_LOCUS508813, partial [marine metagenome]